MCGGGEENRRDAEWVVAWVGEGCRRDVLPCRRETVDEEQSEREIHPMSNL